MTHRYALEELLNLGEQSVGTVSLSESAELGRWIKCLVGVAIFVPPPLSHTLEIDSCIQLGTIVVFTPVFESCLCLSLPVPLLLLTWSCSLPVASFMVLPYPIRIRR